MIIRYGLPFISAVLLTFATVAVVHNRKPQVLVDPPIPPAESSFARHIAAVGLVEPSSESIAIGTNLPGVVTRVHVAEGQRVAAGAPLFTVDPREAKAELAVREARLAVMREKLAELESYPRPEDIPPLEARVEAAAASVLQAQIDLDDKRRELAFFERAENQGASNEYELEDYRYAVRLAEARLETNRARLSEARTQLDLMKAGTFAPVIATARAEVARAEAEVAAIRTTLERLTVTAPLAATVLQVNIRAGEYAPAGALVQPLMILGATDVLHVRVDVDEVDAHRVRPAAAAVAHLRGDASRSAPLEFVRFEPYVVPKRSLTGDAGERVDTRVLQVLFRFDPAKLPVFVGQQVDVFVEERAADED
jgi:multidrug resistance efflux pump